MNITDLEANRGNSEAVAVHQEVPKEEATAETIVALEDRYGDRHQAVGRHRQPKKGIQSDGVSRQKLASARGRLTSCAVPARRKGAVIKDRRSRRDDGRTRNATTA
jgi:hypothetical protein